MSGGVRGKYAKQYHEGVKLIMLDADVAKIFPDAKSVNEALITLSKVILQHQKNCLSKTGFANPSATFPTTLC